MRLFIVLGLIVFAAVQKTGGLGLGECTRYLLPDVADDKFTASTYWCHNFSPCVADGFPMGGGPKYARLNSEGWYTGSWIPRVLTNQYIQVDLGTPKLITAIAIRARDFGPKNVTEYVTAFKLQISTDCSTFQTVKGTDGEDKTFPGNTGLDTIVTNELETMVTARCVKINPTAWHSSPSLRFDIIGF